MWIQCFCCFHHSVRIARLLQLYVESSQDKWSEHLLWNKAHLLVTRISIAKDVFDITFYKWFSSLHCDACVSRACLRKYWPVFGCRRTAYILFKLTFLTKCDVTFILTNVRGYLPMPLKPMHVLTSELCDKHVQQHGAKHFNFAVHLFLHSAPSTQAVQTLMMCASCCRHYVLKQLQQWQCSSSSCEWPAASLWRRFHCGGAHEERKKKKKKKTEREKKERAKREKETFTNF